MSSKKHLRSQMYGFEVTKLIMLRTTTLCLLLVEGFLIVKAQDIVNYPSNSSVTNCSPIEGYAQDCLLCYMCEGNVFQNLERKKSHLYKIKLFDSDCQPKEFCCYAQDNLSARDLGECGKSEPAGYPRDVRKSLRSVLQGQYPWRTWIFSEGSTKPLCAGVYIRHNNGAVITSATCVDNYTAQKLRVGFTRSDGNIHVKKIHKYTDTPTNDIVLLALLEKDALSPWAHPACLPLIRSVQTSCIAVSDQDLYLNTLVPNQVSCAVNGQLDVTKLCAVVAKGDYIPEVGGGMFCEQETTLNNVNYVVNGIHLYQSNNISVYTNISHYVNWIQEELSTNKL